MKKISCLNFSFQVDKNTINFRACHPGDHYWDCYPGALSLRQVTAIYLKTGPVNFIYRCLIFKGVPETWLHIPGPRFNIKMSSYQYRKSHCGEKTVVRSSYLHNGISCTGKMTSYIESALRILAPAMAAGWHAPLTHWGRVTHICISKLTIIASDNGLTPDWHQAIIRTSAGIWLIPTQGTNFNEVCEIHTFSFKKIHLKMSSAKLRQFCLSLKVLRRGRDGGCISLIHVYEKHMIIDQFHNFQNAPAPYPTMFHSEQKCSHLWNRCILGFVNEVNWQTTMTKFKFFIYFIPIDPITKCCISIQIYVINFHPFCVVIEYSLVTLLSSCLLTQWGPKQNICYFANIFKCNFLNKKFCILIQFCVYGSYGQ